MTRTEALSILRRLTAAWPSHELTDDTVAVWVDYLRDVNAEAGRTAALELIGHLEWFPTVVAFRRHAVAVLRREQAKVRALPEPAPDREYALAQIRAIRKEHKL